MTEENRDQRFTATMLAMAEVFNEPVSPVKITAYAEALQHVPMDDLEAAARRLIAEARFFPRPVEWRETAIDVHLANRARVRDEMARTRGIAQRSEVEDKSVDIKGMIGRLAERMGWR